MILGESATGLENVVRGCMWKGVYLCFNDLSL